MASRLSGGMLGLVRRISENDALCVFGSRWMDSRGFCCWVFVAGYDWLSWFVIMWVLRTDVEIVAYKV